MPNMQKSKIKQFYKQKCYLGISRKSKHTRDVAITLKAQYHKTLQNKNCIK